MKDERMKGESIAMKDESIAMHIFVIYIHVYAAVMTVVSYHKRTCLNALSLSLSSTNLNSFTCDRNSRTCH